MHLLALISAFAFGQAGFGGTFIGAVVCDNGIVIAADSRSTFIDESGHRFGYIDGFPKIFAGPAGAFAVSGLTSVKGDLFDVFVRKNAFLLERPADELLLDVALYLPFQNTTKVLLLSAGYNKGQPSICAKSPTDPQTCRNSGYIANQESASLRAWHAGLRSAPTKEAAAAALKRAIAETATADVTIGGPVSVLYVTRTGAPQWIENGERGRGWTSVCDIVRDYRQGKADVRPVGTKAELDSFLQKTCPGK